MSAPVHAQGNQPEGVPPLTLTGERTLPDIPAENYWFRRHLAVYEWVAARVHGLRVLDLACGEVLDHARSLVGGRGIVFVSTPNVRTLAPKGASRSDNPWHVHEYDAGEFEQLCAAHFATVGMYGVFHARKLRAHDQALRLGWDVLHPRLRLTDRFYRWFTPAIAASDFLVRAGPEVRLRRALDFLAVCRA